MIRPTTNTGNARLWVIVSARFGDDGKPVEWFDYYCRTWHPVVDGRAECPLAAPLRSTGGRARKRVG